MCDSQRFILGPETGSLESELAALIGVPGAVAVSPATDALLVSMMALEIGPGHEVVTSTCSFFATAGCITRLGATPVLVDIDPETFSGSVRPGTRDYAEDPRDRAGALVRTMCRHGCQAAILRVLSRMPSHRRRIHWPFRFMGN